MVTMTVTVMKICLPSTEAIKVSFMKLMKKSYNLETVLLTHVLCHQHIESTK